MGAASQELTERAKLLISERRYQEAVRACRRALLSQPDQVEIRLLLGEALLALQRYDEVRVEMMALARKVGNQSAVYRLLGEAYLRDGRPHEAVDALQRALQIDPADEIARELLTEASDEHAPVSTTIERWFADEAEPTIETDSPDWEEEHTGPIPVLPHLQPATAPGSQPPPPSIQVDPELSAPAPAAAPHARSAAPSTNPARPAPRVRSRKPTVAGYGAAEPPVAPPPGAGAPPAAGTPWNAGSLGDAGSLGAQPAGFGGPPATESPRWQATASPHPTYSDDDEEGTLAAKPSARRAEPPEPETDEISLEELASDELSMEEITAEPIFGGPPRDPSPRPAPRARIDPLDAAPTGAFHPPPEELLPPAAPPPGPPPRAHAPPEPFGEQEPPTLGDFSKRRAAAEPAAAATPGRADRFAPAPPGAPSRPAPAAKADPATASPPPGVSDRGARTARVSKERPRWLVPAIGAAGGLLLLAAVTATAVWIWVGASAVEEIRESAAAAGDSGDRGALEAVVAQIGEEEDPELVALKARLLATLTLEHGADRAAEAQALLSSSSVAGGGPPDAAIARALLAIDRGEPTDALTALSALPVRGEQVAEAHRARALAKIALGSLEDAEEAAREAAALRPTSPRHVALRALTLHLTDHSSEGLTLLEGLPAGDEHPGVRATRARILKESGSDPARADQEAAAVIEQLSEAATPDQLAWARLVRAEVASDDGDGATALEHARAAAESPPNDPGFGIRLVTVLLRSGAAEEADRHLARIPERGGDDPERALLTAQVALAREDLDRADQALEGAGEGPAQSMLRGQILEARGQPDRARPIYEEILDAPGPPGRRARTRLGAMAMRAGEPGRAIELLEPALRGAPDDLELVPLLARAYLQRDRDDDAERILGRALASRPGAAELLAARGALELHRGQTEAALASLREAARARPQDPELQVDLGDAARQSGERQAASEAYEAALQLRGDHPRALVGLTALALRGGDLDEAERRLDGLPASADGAEVARLRGQLLVRRGAGAAGVETLQPLAREHRSDAAVQVALGRLLLQAEDDRSAGRAFTRALRADDDNPEALLGRALVELRAGYLSRAGSSVDLAEREARERGLAEQLAGSVAVMRGRLEFEGASFDAAVRHANEALEADADLATAHLLLANVAIERGQSPIEHLRAAVSGDAPPPEALGRLASRLPRGDEACELAARYLQVAPRGYDAPDVREVQRRCR